MWGKVLKSIGTWIVRLAPGIVQAVIEAKAKKDTAGV
jgi:hypothetical protein